ncbi:hypothetical protein PISMIDRAFT_511832 [Pisolithus microcarpus 441]|uniref:Uncharacterized protein n=1 Tax=Pisolithus microcarpus 441 TaxID=765257 RepID=A0A0C9YZM0_9AGAM|nr:hypothetical protein PISMIDRAFT_511832 [Pisolithus microcarpus 441]
MIAYTPPAFSTRDLSTVPLLFNLPCITTLRSKFLEVSATRLMPRWHRRHCRIAGERWDVVQLPDSCLAYGLCKYVHPYKTLESSTAVPCLSTAPFVHGRIPLLIRRVLNFWPEQCILLARRRAQRFLLFAYLLLLLLTFLTIYVTHLSPDFFLRVISCMPISEITTRPTDAFASQCRAILVPNQLKGCIIDRLHHVNIIV